MHRLKKTAEFALFLESSLFHVVYHQYSDQWQPAKGRTSCISDENQSVIRDFCFRSWYFIDDKIESNGQRITLEFCMRILSSWISLALLRRCKPMKPLKISKPKKMCISALASFPIEEFFCPLSMFCQIALEHNIKTYGGGIWAVYRIARPNL